MFSSLASRYDLINGFLSFGLDRLWRRTTARELPLPPACRILDICTGTAAMALAFARRQPKALITAVDLSPEMLAIAARKIAAKHLEKNILLAEGDALNLPFADNSFDISVMGFGLRNLADARQSILEMKRVTKTSGHILVLEFSPVPGAMGPLRFYLRKILPAAGALLSGQKGPYEYLASSIENFLTPEEMRGLLKESGFENVVTKPLTGRVACLSCGRKTSHASC